MKFSQWFPYALIFALLGVLIMQTCKKPKPEKPVITTKVEKGFIPSVGKVVVPEPKKVATEKQPIPQAAKPSKNYDSLAMQYVALLEQFYAINRYVDTIRFDSSFIVAKNAVNNNQLTGSLYDWHMKYPYTKETTTITTTKHDGRQVYLGASVGGINQLSGATIGGSVLYKNRKDNITAVAVKIDNVGNYQYELTRYFKISFKRR